MTDIYGRPQGRTSGVKATNGGPGAAKHVDPAAITASSSGEHVAAGSRSSDPSPMRPQLRKFSSGHITASARSRSGDRMSPGRYSSGYARSASALSTTSRLDAVSSRLRVEEELWTQHVEASAKHRDEVKRRAAMLEEQKKQRARDVLQREAERSRECIMENQLAFQRHLERSHELQALRHEHVEQQAAARRRWEHELDESNARRTEEAARRHWHDLAKRRESIHNATETRMMTARERQEQLQRARQQAIREKMERDEAQARAAQQEAAARRQQHKAKHNEANERVDFVTKRAEELRQKRIAAVQAKEREAERRSEAAKRAHQEELRRRRERKAIQDEEARRKRAEAEAKAENRRAAIEAHFEETIAVAAEAADHKRRVYRAPQHKWF